MQRGRLGGHSHPRFRFARAGDALLGFLPLGHLQRKGATPDSWLQTVRCSVSRSPSWPNPLRSLHSLRKTGSSLSGTTFDRKIGLKAVPSRPTRGRISYCEDGRSPPFLSQLPKRNVTFRFHCHLEVESDA